MKLLRNALWMSLALFAAACADAKSVDHAALTGKLAEVNKRICACKDMACVDSTEKEFALLWQEVLAANKDDRAVLSKYAEQDVEHNKCVKEAMAAMGHK
ncbi:hypothetical protein [Nannocystis punicea]|uniref:Uncharacterized protein n=1 Tax=Nannocystis punicea TaxID=2995304 RepID=A0ABY7HCS4_9BACT|nr:hypothetical protein [Nannocystis poenicansa]WAS97062.1 hypothetical protein O0S08_13015 [Nannocystis poenicansa]